MRAPDFWRAGGNTLWPTVLAPAAALYGAIAGRRMWREGFRATVPVICVGNFTAGGAGKTPTAIAVARLLAEAGERPFFLTRGYGGSNPGPVRVSHEHTAAQVGDEPILLSRTAPTVVARDRPAGARFAIAAGASIIVMDDGMQNPTLTKDLVVAVVDGRFGLGNGLVMPAGPLRAPMAAQWPRVGTLAVLGEGAAGEAFARRAAARGIPVVHANLVPDRVAAARLSGVRVLALSAIGRPEKFAATLGACGAHVEEVRSFPDHHPFSVAEIADVEAVAAARNLRIVTTEKDAVRLGGERFDVLPVRFVPDDVEGFRRLVLAVTPPRAHSAGTPPASRR